MGLVITLIVGMGAAIIFTLAHYNRCLDDIEKGDDNGKYTRKYK